MPFTPEENDDAEMDAEASGKAIYRSPIEGVKAMEARIARLEKRLNQIHPDAVGSDAEIALIRDIRTSKTRLGEFQMQLKGQN